MKRSSGDLKVESVGDGENDDEPVSEDEKAVRQTKKKKKVEAAPVYRGLRPGNEFNKSVMDTLMRKIKGTFLANELDSRVLAELRDRWEQRIQQLKEDELQKVAAKEEEEMANLLAAVPSGTQQQQQAADDEEDDDERLDNSDLGSFDDIDDIIVVETNNVMLCQVSSHKRAKSTRGGTSVYRRRITLEKGMVTIKGEPYVFKQLQGEFSEK